MVTSLYVFVFRAQSHPCRNFLPLRKSLELDRAFNVIFVVLFVCVFMPIGFQNTAKFTATRAFHHKCFECMVNPDLLQSKTSKGPL
jgi:hypothetical protein